MPVRINLSVRRGDRGKQIDDGDNTSKHTNNLYCTCSTDFEVGGRRFDFHLFSSQHVSKEVEL